MYQTALVTGATRGIGKALVEQLTALGVRIYATGRDAVALEALKAATGCEGGVFDLSDAAQVLALFAEANRALGQVDVLINNAGFNSRKAPFAETTLEEFELQYAVNLRAPYLLCREALRQMQTRGQGYIINVISTAAKRSNPTMSVYTAMKQGLHGLTGVLMKEAQPHGVKVTAVYPGGTDTEFRAVPRPDYMAPESVARLIVQLLTNPADVVVHELTFRPPVELE